jgi:hypothetical protein
MVVVTHASWASTVWVEVNESADLHAVATVSRQCCPLVGAVVPPLPGGVPVFGFPHPGIKRKTCIDKYRKNCTGSTPSGSTPSKNVLVKKGTKCATLFEDDQFNGAKYDITTDVDATAKDQVVKTVNDISELGVKGLSSIVFEKGFQGNLCSKKYMSGECFWHDKNWANFGTMNDKYQSLEIHYKGE